MQLADSLPDLLHNNHGKKTHKTSPGRDSDFFEADESTCFTGNRLGETHCMLWELLVTCPMPSFRQRSLLVLLKWNCNTKDIGGSPHDVVVLEDGTCTTTCRLVKTKNELL